MTNPHPTIHIGTQLLTDTARLLATFAEYMPSEGVVYWFGLELGRVAVVTTLVVPDADTDAGRVSTSAAANAEALNVVVGTPLVLLGQAHSHPSRNVDHSWVDDRDTFAQFDGALSVVVPHYGRRGMDLSRCGVHRHVDGRYERIKKADLRTHIWVLPSLAEYRRGRSNV